MPALRLFGRKWLAASDDLVFPGLFEIFVRTLWLILIVIVHVKYYDSTWECTRGGDYVRTYIIGMMALLTLVILVLVALVNRSAKGSITDEEARKLVPPILLLKLFLIIPETVLNVFGTMWAFCNDLVVCPYEGHFSRTVIEALVVFNWALFGLAIFGLALVFDPLGSRRYHEVQETPSAGESLRHRKVTSLWQRRFRWAFCWVKSDEHGHEAFQQVAALLSALFRSTDLVPSDILAGCVLLRVKQKRETREMRRIQMLSDDEPKYSSDINRVFAIAPRWMNLENARHFLRLSMAAYGWPFVMYRYCGTGLFRLLREVTCCSCFRPKRTLVTDDNCCLCHLAGVKYMSKIREEDILFASFRNHVFELPFCVIADHKTSNIVIAIRGSISLRDMFTDLTATSEKFEAECLPPDTMAHKGMMCGANYVSRRLKEVGILDKALAMYPEYGLVLTGHSLGAGVACLLALKIRHKYPDLKVYAFSTPAGLLSRDAARLTENFVFTVGVGDDFVMRLGVDSIENLRTGIIQTLHASRLPKGEFDWLLRSRIRIKLISQKGEIIPKCLHEIGNVCDYHKFRGTVLPVLALNEVFVGETISSRVSHLQIRLNGSVEQTGIKCSGVCVCTGTGSTSWHLSINRLPVQSVCELLKLVEIPAYEERDVLVKKIADNYNKNLIFKPDDTRMCYTIRDLISAGVWPHPKGIKSRDFISKLEIKSNCYNASLVVDGGVSFDFNDGTIAILEIRPEDALRTVTLQ